jgi:thiamine-phosphate pyrophosphorylase
MSEVTLISSRQVLALLARRLNREAGAPALPSLFFLTDPGRTPDPIASAHRLPAGAALIYRHFGAADRHRTARALARVCRRRGLLLLIAADPELAAGVGADGVHWPERLLPARCQGLATAAAHSLKAVRRAHAAGAAACLLSPVFATASASARAPLGLFHASQIARGSPLPVIALGGVRQTNARQLIGRGFAGIGAVASLA